MSKSTALLIDGYPVVWKSPDHLIHYCDGSVVHPGVRLIWTVCGKYDVPANRSWRQREGDNVTCAACLTDVDRENETDAERRHRLRENVSMFG